jgi:hypothetical protein
MNNDSAPVTISCPTTLNNAELCDSRVSEAFLAGFAAARAGKVGARAPKAYSPGERSAFAMGKNDGKRSHYATGEDALEAFIVTELFWSGSCVASLRAHVEAGNVRTIHVGE